MATMKELRLNAEAFMNNGIKNRDALTQALPVLIDLKNATDIQCRNVRACQKLIRNLDDACADYAIDHPSVFTDGLRTVDGVQVGDVLVEDAIYHLASGYGSPKRLNGEQLSQGFLGELPHDWTKAKLELDTTAINRAGVSYEELERNGLYRPAKNEWCEKF